MRWLIVEDALRDRKGHWLEYVSTFVRELRALGDEVVVLCDRKAQGFVMEQTGARRALPESIWHRMGDGAGAVKRYMRVPGHAVATFFAMRKVLRGFNHEKTRKNTKGQKRGARSGEQGDGSFEPPITLINTDEGRVAGPCLDKPSGAAFSNPFTSELARDSENTSLIRSADAPALAALPQDENVEKRKAKSGNLPATSHPLPDTAPEALALDARRSTLDSSPASPDWIFVPTVLVHHLLGWWMLLKTRSVPGDSRVLLFFPNLPIRLDDTGEATWNGGPTTKLMAWLFGQLRNELESGKVVLGVETHAMRRALEGLIGMPVVYLPHPVPAKPGQGEARVEGRESSDGAGFPAEAQRRGDLLTTIERQGGCEKEQLKVGPKGEGVGTNESNDTDLHGWGTTNHTKLHERGEAGQRLAGQVGVSESDSLASELADSPVSESRIRSADSPSVALDAGRSTLDAEASASPIVFGCYGAARWEKGSDIFQEAIKRILKNAVASAETTCVWDCAGEPANGGPKGESRGSDRGNRVSSVRNQSAAGLSEPVTRDSLPATAAGRPLRFAIQWVEDFRDREGNLVSMNPWLREHPQVEVIGRYFQGGEYERRLAQTDVMVLPYRSPYQLRVSRVVIEAMLNGMPVIATRGTTLFEQAKEYGVVVGCDEGDAESLAEALLEVAARFEEMRADAEEKVSAVAESFSVGYFRDFLKKSISQNHIAFERFAKPKKLVDKK